MSAAELQQSGPELQPPAGGAPRAARRRLAAAAWGLAGIVVYGFFLRISDGARIVSDGANSALQGWDLIHGHVLLHGWLFGDATYYSFELPVNGVAELIFGLGPKAVHVASALVYFIVAALAVALAVAGAAGLARVARGAVAVTVLAVPLLTLMMAWVLVEEPDHPGTAAFLLLSALLMDQFRDRWFAPPLVGVLLCAGQLSDATVLYVGVPAVTLTSLYRALAARKLRSADAAIMVAAIASVPLAVAIRALEVHFGGYLMVAPRTQIAPLGQWPQHVPAVWLAVRQLFGAVLQPDTKLGAAGAGLGLLCLIAAIAGLARVAWTWRRASAAEQVLALVILLNLGAYLAGHVGADGAHEIPVVLPSGAVLAARLVPREIAGRARGFAGAVLAALLALVPLSAAATRPPVGPALGPAPGNGLSAPTAPLTRWLESHSYTYGLSSYWDSSVVSLESGGKVDIRAITVAKASPAPGTPMLVRAPYWEANALWYDPALHDATFVVAYRTGRYTVATFEKAFGKPTAIHLVGNRWLVMDYKTNLLGTLLPRLAMGQGAKS